MANSERRRASPHLKMNSLEDLWILIKESTLSCGDARWEKDYESLRCLLSTPTG